MVKNLSFKFIIILIIGILEGQTAAYKPVLENGAWS
jgi:hypothetical protein